ncbi:MAG TPA: TOBE domain-containing protein, partial [Bradyrhizobium sp.]|nr:TOBE domain-containing protein [Bradyrhizobium sp.]
ETADGTILRVVAPTEPAVPRGTEVWLSLPPERCRALNR